MKASLVPMVVEKLREKFTMQVCCGAHHTLAVCRGGAGEDVDRKIVYAMGLNASGQLGIGSKASNAWLPTALSLPSSFLLQSVTSGCLALHSFLFSRGVPLRRSTLPRIDLQFLAAACARLKSSKNDPSALQTLRENVVTVFSSISCVNASFLKREESLCHDVVSSPHSFSASVDLPSVREAYNLLTLTGDESVMATLGRATLHLTDQLKECPYDDLENLNCFLIVLENPLLLNPHLFHIGIERVITGILALPSSYRSTLFNWLRSYESQYFQRIVTVMQSYLSYALQNTRLRLDPSPVTLVLNSLYECNHSTAGSIVPDDAFYNAALEESVDLIADCEAYLSEKREKLNSVVFRFCRFPFLLPLSAKNRILQHELTFQKTQVVRPAYSL